jgi:uncharacterized protein
MRTRVSALLGLAGVALVLGSCVSLRRTPEARFFVLRSLVEPLPPGATPAPGAVGVLNVRLPGHLERPQIIVWRAPNEVSVDEFTRWAEPLGGAVSRVLAENLAALLPEHPVVRYPWPAATKLIGRVAVEIRSFAPQPSGEVQLEGRWTILTPDQERAVAFRPFVLTRGPLPAGPEGADPGASVEAMSALLADLAREIAPALRVLPAPAS